MKPKPPARSLTFDVEKYQAILDAPDISPDQQKVFLEAMWQVVVGFVDLGFRVVPSGPRKESCGQDICSMHANPSSAPLMVSSDVTPISKVFASSTQQANEEV